MASSVTHFMVLRTLVPSVDIATSSEYGEAPAFAMAAARADLLTPLFVPACGL